MPTSQSVPGDMIEDLLPPENGYQTPQWPEDGEIFFESVSPRSNPFLDPRSPIKDDYVDRNEVQTEKTRTANDTYQDAKILLREERLEHEFPLAPSPKAEESVDREWGTAQMDPSEKQDSISLHPNNFRLGEGRRRRGQASIDRSSNLCTINSSNTNAEGLAGIRRKIGIRERVSFYTWTWFTLTMATGGIANVLFSIPFRSEWLRIIGTIVFLFNILLFLINCVLITLRFLWNPGSLKASFTSQSESLFVPACVVSTGTILTNICQYGIPESGPWFQRCMEICFWIYVALSFVTSAAIYLIIWSTQTFPIHTMTPIWIFPAYPLLMTAPLAGNFINALPDTEIATHINTKAIALSAIATQGTGFAVSLMVYSAFIYRLMSQKLPRQTARPGMFVSVGPSAFTVAGIVLLGNTAASKVLPYGDTDLDQNPNFALIVKLLADLVGLWLWGLCLWFFLVSIGAHWHIILHPTDPKHRIRFDMTWYSFVFPNTAMVSATQAIGKSLKSHGLQVFGTVMSVILVLLWIFVFCIMIRALMRKRLLWPADSDGPGPVLARKWSLSDPEAGRHHSTMVKSGGGG